MKADLIDFKIQPNLNEIRSKSKDSFKKYVKIKAMEFEFSQLTQQKTHNSKIAGLSYNKLEMQTYFNLENMSAAQAKIAKITEQGWQVMAFNIIAKSLRKKSVYMENMKTFSNQLFQASLLLH